MENISSDQLKCFVFSDRRASLYCIEHQIRESSVLVDLIPKSLWNDPLFMFQAAHLNPSFLLHFYKRMVFRTHIWDNEHHMANFSREYLSGKKLAFSRNVNFEKKVLMELCLTVPDMDTVIEELPTWLCPEKTKYDEQVVKLREFKTGDIKIALKDEVNAHKSWHNLSDLLDLDDDDEEEVERLVNEAYKRLETEDAPPTPWLDFINQNRNNIEVKKSIDAHYSDTGVLDLI